MSEKLEYRCYVFVSSLLSSGQKAVQAFHAGIELCAQYLHEQNYESGHGQTLNIIKQYANVDKTAIILDGGNNGTMKDLLYTLKELSETLDLPLSYFHEDEGTLNNMLTAIAIVVPDSIYGNKLKDAAVLTNAPHPETRLSAILQTHSLAR